MPKNYLLIYSEQLATEIELLCQNIKRGYISGESFSFRIHLVTRTHSIRRNKL